MHIDFNILKISDMRKILLTLLTVFAFAIGGANGQLTVSMSSSEVEQNAEATVNVTVNGFTNLLGVQFSMNFDSTVLQFVNATNFTTALPGLSSAAVSGPNGVGVKNGQITFSWFDPQGNGKSLPAGTNLFSIVFKAIGPKGSKSDVVTSNVPRVIEVVNASFDPITLVNNKGTVTIKGTSNVDPCPNPACSDPNGLLISGKIDSTQKGNNICVSITVKNFRIMQSGQGSIKWDPTLLQYTEVKTPATGGIPGFSGGFNAANAANGEFKYLWFNDNPATPLTLPDNTVIMELCFKVVGDVGKTGCILIGQGTLATEWENDNGPVPVCFGYGKVKIINQPPAESVVINVGTANGMVGETVCVNVTVDNFTSIVGASTTFSWNPQHLEFVRTDMYDLDGLNSSAFNLVGNNQLKFLWISPTAVTKADGHKIFQICFKILQCNPTTPVNVSGPTEIVGTPSIILPSSATPGSVTCTDPPPGCSSTATLGAITSVSCNGLGNGSVALTVTGSNLASHLIVWKNKATGAVVKASAPVTSGTDLTGVPAGTYVYEISFNGTICNTGEATVTQPNVITIPTVGVVTNAACGQKGSINISTTSGGNGGYTYNWIPSLGNTPNPVNLDAGSYSVTVTDSKGCTANASFVVGTTETDITVSASGTNVKCKDGSDGAIQVTVSGGCPPYIFAWSGNLSGQNPQNLKAGVYSITVSDSATPAHVKTASVTITEPANAVAVSLTGVTDASTAAASDGKISLSCSGGTPNYTLIWAGPTSIPDGNTSGAIDANNVKAGTYSVTVTDANGCTAVRSNIVVGVRPPVDTTKAPKLGDVKVASSFNGFGVSCFGVSDGIITANITEGGYPVTVNLKSGSQTVKSIVVNGPAISFTGLGAGTYTIEATNNKGTVTSQPIEIKQPTKLAATQRVNCTEKDKETGSIEILMNNTGAGNYTYSWLGLPDNSSKVEDLATGFYNVTVTDANGCELKLTNIEIKECSVAGPCYEATTVITPNGDNFNDVFLINCVLDNSSDLSVYDRWGRLVYSQNNYDNTWQGIDNSGKDLREGGYIWVLTVNFGQGRKEVHKGTVTLLRGL